MELANFPSEVLAEITAYTHGSAAIVSLWKCGNAVLQTKLSQCITKLDLKDQRLVSQSRFPKLICSLKNLRSLVLDRGNWPLMSSSRQLFQEIQSLPLTKLEELNLTCSFDHSALEFFKFQDGAGSSSKTAHTGSKITLWNLSHCFPTLRTLKLAFGDELSIPLNDLLRGLPSTLTHLAIPLPDIKDCQAPLLSLLPTDLLHLEATIAISETAAMDLSPSSPPWRKPPPHLHTITSIVIRYPDAVSSFKFLPRTITTCDIQCYYWTSDLVATLPPGFQGITIEHCSQLDPVVSHWIPPLAREMTLLSYTIEHLATTLHFFESLPKTLNTLYLAQEHQDYEWPVAMTSSFSPAAFWPPGLTSLNISPYLLSSEHLGTLPVTLTSLMVTWSSGEPIDCAQLPRGLEELYVFLQSDLSTLSLLPGFSNSLRSLALFADGTGSKVSWQILTVLPSSLRSLEVESDLDPWMSCLHDDIKLPPSLTKLEVSYWPHDCFAQLPSSLRSFTVSNSHFLASYGADTIDYFEKLPAGLEDINMRFRGDKSSMNICCTGTSFSQLVNLKSIRANLRFDGSLFKTISEKLPKLTMLSVDEICLTPEYAPMIPLNLELNMGTMNEAEIKTWATYWPPASEWVSHLRTALSYSSVARARRIKAKEYAQQYPAPQNYKL